MFLQNLTLTSTRITRPKAQNTEVKLWQEFVFFVLHLKTFNPPNQSAAKLKQNMPKGT